MPPVYLTDNFRRPRTHGKDLRGTDSFSEKATAIETASRFCIRPILNTKSVAICRLRATFDLQVSISLPATAHMRPPRLEQARVSLPEGSPNLISYVISAKLKGEGGGKENPYALLGESLPARDGARNQPEDEGGRRMGWVCRNVA